jgi:integrase/recombinase XerD
MNLKTKAPGSITVDDYLLTWLEAFLIDRKARGMAKGTITFYTKKLKLFVDYCDTQVVKNISQITPALIREYLLYLESGYNPGGIHACYRALKTFLFWWEDETEPVGWRNPIRKVKAPKLAVEPITGVSLETVMQLVKACKRGTFTGDRGAAIFLTLFDTGARAAELLSMNLEDVSVTGEILIRSGKGRKPRYVYLGRTARKALRRYLKHRRDDHPALWVVHPDWGPGRLAYSGLKMILKRAAKRAGIDKPALHDFRRGFALAMLRNGTDIFTLAKLMGHSGITVLQRYLAQTDQDAKEAHRRASPVDSL